jgi:hypothetical protein
MAIASRRVIVVGNEWRILRERIVHIGINRHAIAINLPITWYRHSCPLSIVIAHSLETFGGFGRGCCPMKLPIPTDILDPLRCATRECLSKRGIRGKRSPRGELIYSKHLWLLPVGMLLGRGDEASYAQK